MFKSAPRFVHGWGFTAALLASALLAPARPAAAQAKDPLMGTWALNFGKSDFKREVAPTSKTLVFTPVSNGFAEKVTILNNNGATDNFDFTAKFDGKEYDMPPESPLNSITIERIDPDTVEQTGIERKQVAETVTYKVSNGGKTLTVTTVGTKDHTADSVQVYDREATSLSKR